MSRLVDPESFGFITTDLSRLIRAEFDRRIGDSGIGLTAGEARALTYAARAGLVRQNVIAERMGVEAMTVSAYLDRLESHGLVRRVPDPDDRRAKLVELTDSADPMLARIKSLADAIRLDASANIPPEEWAHMIAMLKTVRANLMETRSVQPRITESSIA